MLLLNGQGLRENKMKKSSEYLQGKLDCYGRLSELYNTLIGIGVSPVNLVLGLRGELDKIAKELKEEIKELKE